MDRKPDAGCEIQYTFYVMIMVMINLKLVKGKAVDNASATENGTEISRGVNHGTKLLKDLVKT